MSADRPPILQFFAFAHLPPHLQDVSRPFGELAEKVAELPRNAESSTALRKLLEAKDAAVRAIVAVALLCCLLPSVALAQGGDAVAVDVLALISQALAMGPAGLALGVAALLVGLVQLVRTFGGRLHPSLGTPRAAAITSLVLAILGALVTTLAAGAQISLAVVLNAILAGLTASGLFSASKAVIQRSEKAGSDAAAAIGGKAAAQAAIAASPEQ